MDSTVNHDEVDEIPWTPPPPLTDEDEDLTRALREFGDPEIVLLPGAFVVGPRINHSVTTHTMDATWHRFPKR